MARRLGRFDWVKRFISRKPAYERSRDEEAGRIASRRLARSPRPEEAKDLLAEISLPTKGTQLSEAEADTLLTRMFVALDEPPPIGFNEVLRIAKSLDAQPTVTSCPKRQARLELYRAAAYGQCYAFSPGKKTAEELAMLRTRALDAVRAALARDSGMQPVLKTMLLGEGKGDDLASFKEDLDFRTAILGSCPL
jgi:hypothetical protein